MLRIRAGGKNRVPSLRSISGVLKRVFAFITVLSIIYSIQANNWGWQENARDQISKSSTTTTENEQRTVAHGTNQPKGSHNDTQLNILRSQQSSNRPRKKTRKRGKIKLANHRVPGVAFGEPRRRASPGVFNQSIIKGAFTPHTPVSSVLQPQQYRL